MLLMQPLVKQNYAKNFYRIINVLIIFVNMPMKYKI